MAFTGERYIPSILGSIEIEHLHRYAVAMEIAKGKQVLDLACGDGYGSALLSRVAKDVVGIDISSETIVNASSEYKACTNLSFITANAIATNLESRQFDLIVSFETVEHMAEQDELLAEISRLLKPDGVLIISSPNRPVYSEGRQEPNRFHIKELDFSEFDLLLKRHFSKIEYYGQRMMMATIVQPLHTIPCDFRAFSGHANSVTPQAAELLKPVYFIGLCSNSHLPLPVPESSIYFPDGLDLVEHLTGLGRWAKKQDAEIEKKNKKINQLNEQLTLAIAEREKEKNSLGDKNHEYSSRLDSLMKEVSTLQNELIGAEAQLALLKEMLSYEQDSLDAL